MSCAPACLPSSPPCFNRDSKGKESTASPASTLLASLKEIKASLKAPTLSSRGNAHRDKVTPFWCIFDRILSDAFCSKKNPNGIVNMGIANNYLMEKELLAYMERDLRLDPTDLTYGTSLFGSIRLFDALCKFYNSSAFSPKKKVLPEHVLTGPGCGSLLDQLFEHLCDPGDGVLIAAPFYNGFEADLICRSAVNCVPVYSSNGDGTEPESFEGLSALRNFAQTEAHWNELHKRKAIKAIIVNNPNNPVGRCYTRSALIEYGKYAEQNDLHLVFDEIYALSTFPTESEEQPSQPFISSLAIDWAVEAGCHPGRIHVLSSASKDFGLNGFRVGFLITQNNDDLIRAMKDTSKLYAVSSPADALFSSIVTNDDFFEDFVRTNHARMASAYGLVTEWCRHHRIKYTPTNSGHFILVDLERFMLDNVGERTLTDEEREGALWSKALEVGVNITPGSNYYHPHRGTFRLTFTLERLALLEGLRRLECALDLDHWTAPAQTTPAMMSYGTRMPSEDLTDKGMDEESRMKQLLKTQHKSSMEAALHPKRVQTNQGVQTLSQNLSGEDAEYAKVQAATELMRSQACAC